MREIKFRAWAHTSEKMFCPYTDDGWEITDGVLTPLPNTTLEQFTGLHDKNGAEIYEGDIVKTGWHWSKSEALTQAVEYDSASAVYIPFGTNDWSWDANACEVIGNIHKNPEFLS